MGGGVFTASIPQYINVSKFPSFLGETKEDVSTDYLFWVSRLIAALVDANYGKCVIFAERYQAETLNKSFKMLHNTDLEFTKTKNLSLLENTNEKIAEELKTDSLKVLKRVLNIASDNMKTRFNRSDN